MTDEYGDELTVKEILDTYPGAKPFSDLIGADNLRDFADVAKDLDSRVKNLSGEQAKPSSTGHSAKPKPEAVSVQEAIQKRSWTDYLSAKWDATAEERD